MLTIENDCIYAVNYLIANKININRVNRIDNTPLLVAVKKVAWKSLIS